MSEKSNNDVLVVGAGPVGLFSALALTRRGVDVRIIDREWRTGAHSYALALHPTTLRLMERVGLRESVLDRAHRVRTIAIYDGAQRKHEIPITAVGEEFAFLSVLRQDALESVLEEALREAGVRVKWNHEASLIREVADAVEVRVDRLEGESRGYGVEHGEKVVARTQMLKPAFVIGADGHESDVRQSLQIGYQDLGGAKHFAVFEFQTDAESGDEVRIVLHKGTSSILWPMADGFCRWSFEVPHTEYGALRRSKDRYVTESPDAVSATLQESDLRTLLRERAPWFEGSIESISWRKIVRFERRLADAFGRGRVWLAGDSAHMALPGGVQSMNVGLREAWLLTDLMTQIVRGAADLNVLAEYDEERRHEWRRLFDLDRPELHVANAWIESHLKELLPTIPLSGKSLEVALALDGLADTATSA
jgi:2-polyprenyl-6-methoxyphenol hydroxylase-like FAD-dependent oxidoreductase